MSDQNDPKKEPCPPSTGARVPASGARITNFAERARESGPAEPESPRLPPRPGRIPESHDVDLHRVLNRDDKAEE